MKGRNTRLAHDFSLFLIEAKATCSQYIKDTCGHRLSTFNVLGFPQ